MTFDCVQQIIYFLGRLSDGQSDRSKGIQQCNSSVWGSDENLFIAVVCEQCGEPSSRPNREIVAHDQSKGFVWNTLPI